jgi:hypothetical protein
MVTGRHRNEGHVRAQVPLASEGERSHDRLAPAAGPVNSHHAWTRRLNLCHTHIRTHTRTHIWTHIRTDMSPPNTHIHIHIFAQTRLISTCRTIASAAAASRSAQSARSTSRKFSPAVRRRAACTLPAVTVPRYSRKLRIGSRRRLAWSFARHSPHTLPNVRMRACGEILVSQCPRILPTKGHHRTGLSRICAG